MEWFMVLSHHCLNCASNETDCFRENCITANGHQRPIRVVNRMLPGPKIQVCLNDEIIVNVKNKLNSFESTTIHWHGVKMFKKNHFDGVAMLTQCPIISHTSFQYRFKAIDRGTHMWHSHAASQRADGLAGALIIREANDVHSKLYDYDLSEHVIVLNDWTDDILLVKEIKFLYSKGDEIIDGILINGKGVEIKEMKNNNMPRSVFNVDSGKSYRFRVINAGVQYCPLELSIEEHNLTIISTDGNPIQPVDVKSFFIMSGERVDFVLNASQNINKNYWIKVKGHADCYEIDGFNVTKIYQTAVLKYNNLKNDLPQKEINYENSGPDPKNVNINYFIISI
jgi:FtsP/CotA-like multicopper oxidase with cupredoxin domain